MARNEAHISIGLTEETKKIFADFAEAINAPYKDVEHRRNPNRCGSCSQHEVIAKLEHDLKQERLDYSAMQRALDSAHKKIRRLQHGVPPDVG